MISVNSKTFNSYLKQQHGNSSVCLSVCLSVSLSVSHSLPLPLSLQQQQQQQQQQQGLRLKQMNHKFRRWSRVLPARKRDSVLNQKVRPVTNVPKDR